MSQETSASARSRPGHACKGRGDSSFQPVQDRGVVSRWRTDIFAGTTYPTVPFVSGVKTVVDIGANVGAASVYFAMAYPDAQVYAFEPGSDPLSLLQKKCGTIAQCNGLSFRPLLPRTERCLCFTARTTVWNRPCAPVLAPVGRVSRFAWCALPIFSASTASNKSMC